MDPGDRSSWCEQCVNADRIKSCTRKAARTMAGKLPGLPCRHNEWEPRPYLIKTRHAGIVVGSSLIHTNGCQLWNTADPHNRLSFHRLHYNLLTEVAQNTAEASNKLWAKLCSVPLKASPSRQARRMAADSIQGKGEKSLKRGWGEGRENSGRRIWKKANRRSVHCLPGR